jgi:glutamine amidotransferase
VCRHLAYLGPPAPLSRLLYDAPHALVRQSWAPRDMRGSGTVNADGFGVGWYPRPGEPPVRYRRDRPMWSDADLPTLAARTAAAGVLAAVRAATPGMPTGAAACAPFTDGAMLFSHNGRITGWPDSVAGLASRLPVTWLLTMEAATDSVLLWALVRRRLADGEPAPSAVAATVAEVERAAPGSRLNLLLTDSRTIVATTAGHSLSVRHDRDRVVVSSEPLDDDPAWRPVPDRHLVVADPTGVEITPLPEGGPP